MNEATIDMISTSLPVDLPQSAVVHLSLVLEGLEVHLRRVPSTVDVAKPIADGLVKAVDVHSGLLVRLQLQLEVSDEV